MKKALIFLIGACLFAGPLFDAFSEGVDISREKFLMFANMDGYIVLYALNYHGNTSKDKDWTDYSTDWWDGQDKEALARRSGKVAYALLLKKRIMETFELNKKLGNVSSYSLNDLRDVAVFVTKETYLDIDNDFDGWCEKLWSYKKYGPGGEISREREGAFWIKKVGPGAITWKAFVLKIIKEATDKKKTEEEKKAK